MPVAILLVLALFFFGILKTHLISSYVSECRGGCVHVSAGAHEAQKPLKLELKVAVSHQIWVRGTQLRSCESSGCS